MANNTSPSTLETYLGTAAPERVGDLVVARFKKWRTTLGATGQYSQWMRNFSQYHGGPADADSETWDSDSYALEGDSAEILSIRINEMRNLITHVLNLTYSKPVGGRAIAMNGNATSLDAADVADALLEDDFRISGGGKIMRRAGEGSLIVSTTFVMPEWDFSVGDDLVPDDTGGMEMTGGPRLNDFWVDEVCFDSTKKDWRDVYDVILLRRCNRFELASRQAPGSEAEQRILCAPSINKSVFTGVRWSDDESDDVCVLHYLHKRVNGRFLPDGREVKCLEDGTIIDDGPNPYAGLGELNVYPVSAAQGLGTVYGYAPANDISPINRLVNLFATIIATNVAAHGSPNLVGPKLAMVDVQNLLGGARYFGVSQGQEVKAMNLLPDMDPIAKLMQMLSQYGEKLSGLSGVMRGDTGDMSGVAIAQVKSMAVQFMSSFQASVVEQHECVFNALIWMRKYFSTGMQKVARLGGDNVQEVLEYDAQKTLGQIARVRAEAIDPVMSTPEGREARAQSLLSQGAFDAPWEYLTLVKTGRDDALWKGPMATNKLIQRENQAMMRGELPPVLQQDAHDKHEVEHLALLADPGIRMNDTLVQIVLEHNARHTMYRMGMNVMQGNDPMTGQPYPSAIVQLEQAKAMAAKQQQAAAQMQAQQPQQGAPQQPQQQGQAQPAAAPQTALDSLQQGAMGQQPN